MRNRRVGTVASLLGIAMLPCLGLLLSCGSCNSCTFPVIANKLLGKVWIGQIVCGQTTRIMRVTFTQSGCSVVGNAVMGDYNGVSGFSFPAGNNASSPVTISGAQATFAPTFQINQSTNNSSKAANPPPD